MPRVIIIRRQERTLFETVLRSSNRWPAGTAVMMDRRERERRVLSLQVLMERRQWQRREEPDARWHSRGFIIVEMDRLPLEAVPLEPTPD